MNSSLKIAKSHLDTILLDRSIKDMYDEILHSHTPELHNSDLIPLDINGKFDYKGEYFNKYNYQTRQYEQIKNDLWCPPKQNYTFVDILSYPIIHDSRPRKGYVKFKSLINKNAQIMRFSIFESCLDKLIKGHLIGIFAYEKYYGHYGIVPVKVEL